MNKNYTAVVSNCNFLGLAYHILKLSACTLKDLIMHKQLCKKFKNFNFFATIQYFSYFPDILGCKGLRLVLRERPILNPELWLVTWDDLGTELGLLLLGDCSRGLLKGVLTKPTDTLEVPGEDGELDVFEVFTLCEFSLLPILGDSMIAGELLDFVLTTVGDFWGITVEGILSAVGVDGLWGAVFSFVDVLAGVDFWLEPLLLSGVFIVALETGALVFFEVLVSFPFFFFGDGVKSLPSEKSESASRSSKPSKLSESVSVRKKFMQNTFHICSLLSQRTAQSTNNTRKQWQYMYLICYCVWQHIGILNKGIFNFLYHLPI